jgi:hypothetical protein
MKGFKISAIITFHLQKLTPQLIYRITNTTQTVSTGQVGTQTLSL